MFAKFASMKKTIYTIIYVYLIGFGSILTGHSMPAYPKPIEVTQPDGTKLTILLKGDEFLHFTQSTDGYDLMQNQEGYYTYANRDSEGRLLSGTVIARNVGDRSTQDMAFLSTVKTGVNFSGSVLSKALQKRMSSTQKGSGGLRSTSSIPPGLLADYPTTGSPKSLVILVNFSDLAFKAVDNTAAFNDMLNSPGYNQNDHVGSVRDYYSYNSGGLFNPDFVVVGPVTIDNPMAYYGANDKDGNDLRPAQMVYDACQQAASLVNFANFDANNDGTVDNVYIYYAGKGEADGGGVNTIWPHSWSLSSANLNLILNGKRINSYACSGELKGSNGQMTGMGTFTHEYSHILGLTDMYDVDYDKYNGDSFDLNYWSLMAYGAYNNNSAVPPCLTLPERYFLGWAKPQELTSTQDVTLTDLGSTNKGYIIKTLNSGEYYLLENRQWSKNIWDAYLPYHGMLIYHIDMRTDQDITINYWGSTLTLNMNEMWLYNMVNAVALHQCCDMEEADNQPLLYTGKNATEYLASIKGDPFPGTSGIGQFTDNTSPSMKTWNGTSLSSPISAISESNGVIRFKFKDYSAFKNTPAILAAKSIGPYSFNAAWNQVANATGYYVSVFTQDLSKNPPVKKDLSGYSNKYVTDTVLTVDVANDLTTYYYQFKATLNDTLFTPISNIAALTTTDGTPVALSATQIDKFSFRANWQKSSYATGYYLDVFSLDSNTGDTLWVDGFKNFYLTKTFQAITELDDQTNYKYLVRATNGKVTSRNSPAISINTTKASEILAYVKDRTIYLKGMDKGGKVVIHYPDGRLGYTANVNHIAVSKPGIYIITATFDGKVKHLKLLVQ
jgi:M6 family metalloprotease-like protein